MRPPVKKHMFLLTSVWFKLQGGLTSLNPREMVVVHPDNEFLEDITGKLKEVSL